MVITFCGHSSYESVAGDEKKILEILEKRVGNSSVEFFLGDYGNFDKFTYDCAKKFKEHHVGAKLVFITPYITVAEYKKDHFDLIVYPELEKIPLRYAILHRNKWMVDQASIVIAYVTHKYGGAYTMYRYAKRKNKEIYNIALQCSN